MITDQHGAILSRGRNRIFDHTPTERAVWGTRLAHAEINALAPLDHRQVDLETCTLYTTTEPCPMCTGAIRMCHVGEVRYAARDNMGGSVALLEASPFMRLHGCRVVGPEREDLEAIILAMHTDLALRLATPRSLSLVEVWDQQCPIGVRLGTELFQRRHLQQLRAAGAAACDVIVELERML